MTPVLQTPTFDLFHGDCLEVMQRMPDKAFDLAIVDPPYGISISNRIGGGRGDRPAKYKEVTWDSKPPPPEYFTHLLRVSRHAIVWGANHFIDRLPIPSATWVFWDKRFSNDVSFSAGELAWTNCSGGVKTFSCSSSDPQRIHPTQKPVALYQWLLTRYAKPGWRILDTHLGSGSSAIACHYAGLHLTAMEADADYVAAACDRFKRETAQADMFSAASFTLSSAGPGPAAETQTLTLFG